MEALLKPVKHVNHGAVCFEDGGTVVWVDPFAIPENSLLADVIVITHAHFDHYSKGDIAKIKQAGTVYVTVADVAALLQSEVGVPAENIRTITTGQTVQPVPGVQVAAVYADNKNHPSPFGFGVVLHFAGVVYYLSGDTDVLDKDAVCDVLFCVADGKYNMPDPINRAPAEIQAMKTPPKLVVPYHYGNGGHPEYGQMLADKLNAMGVPAQLFAGE